MHLDKQNRAVKPRTHKMRRQSSSHSFKEWLKHKASDSTNFEEVLAHLGHIPKSYPDLASVVFQAGHKNLALSLLDQEPEDSKQVETLVKWSENTAAFIKAVESGNPDLIYMVMLKLSEKMTFDKFQKTLRNFPIAIVLYKKHCYQFDKNNLYEIYVQENDFGAQARMLLANKDPDMKSSLLTSAAEAYKKSRNDFNASLCEEQLKLLTFQKQLTEQHPSLDFVGKTVHETCSLLLKLDDLNMAEDFRNEYQIPERRFWWLRIQSLAEVGHWACLEKLSKTKKCPLGFEAFVDACLENNNREEAMRYLPKIAEKLKIKYHIKVGCLEEAAKMAFKKKDEFTLLRVRRMCKEGSALAETVNSFVAKLDNANCQFWHSFSL